MRNGFRIVDTDCHQMEPPTLWQEHIEPAFRDRAPRLEEHGGRPAMMVEGESLVSEGKYPFSSPDFLAALRTKIEVELLDEQSPAHLGPDKGDLIMVDIRTREPETSRPEEETRRRWVRYTVLAAAAVIIVLVAVTLFDSTEDSSIDFVGRPFTESEALEVVEAYYAAVGAGDADAITSMFVENPATSGGLADVDELLRGNVWDAGQGTELLDRTCAGGGSGSAGVVVVCEYDNHQYLQRVVGAPATPKTDTFTVSEDGIEDFDESYSDPLFPANDTFNAWMSANHPEDAVAADCCGGDTVEAARADGELRSRYADEWAAYLTENGCTYDTLCTAEPLLSDADALGVVESYYGAVAQRGRCTHHLGRALSQ